MKRHEKLNSPADPESLLLLRPRGAASLWRWRGSGDGDEGEEEEERVERVGGKLDHALVVIIFIGAAATFAHRLDCLLETAHDPEGTTAGREAEVTAGCEEERGAAEAETAEEEAAAVIERIFPLVEDELLLFNYFFLCRACFFSPPTRQRAARALVPGD